MSDIEDDSILDQHDATLTTDVETPNTFGRNLLRRLGLAQGSEAEATGISSNNNRDFKPALQIICDIHFYTS